MVMNALRRQVFATLALHGEHCELTSRHAFDDAEIQLADSLAPSPNSKLLVGLIGYSVGVSAVTDAPKQKSCELAKMAEDHFLIAQINVPAGGAVNPQAASQILGALAQYGPFVAAQKKQFCK